MKARESVRNAPGLFAVFLSAAPRPGSPIYFKTAKRTRQYAVGLMSYTITAVEAFQPAVMGCRLERKKKGEPPMNTIAGAIAQVNGQYFREAMLSGEKNAAGSPPMVYPIVPSVSVRRRRAPAAARRARHEGAGWP